MCRRTLFAYECPLPTYLPGHPTGWRPRFICIRRVEQPPQSVQHRIPRQTVGPTIIIHAKRVRGGKENVGGRAVSVSCTTLRLKNVFVYTGKKPAGLDVTRVRACICVYVCTRTLGVQVGCANWIRKSFLPYANKYVRNKFIERRQFYDVPLFYSFVAAFKLRPCAKKSIIYIRAPVIWNSVFLLALRVTFTYNIISYTRVRARHSFYRFYRTPFEIKRRSDNASDLSIGKRHVNPPA